MRKFIYLFILLVVISLFPVNSYSQFLYFGPSIGVTLPTGDYVGSTMEYYSGENFGMKLGANFGAEARLVTPYVNVKGFYKYNLFKNNGNADLSGGNIEIKQYISEFGIGPEYMINIPKSTVKPHVDVMFLYSVFSGSVDFRGLTTIADGIYDMNTASRTGIGLGAGAEVKLKNFYIDFSLRYNFMNLLKKSFSGGEERLASYTSLNDESDPLYNGTDINHPIGSNRTISLFQFNVSVIYGIEF